MDQRKLVDIKKAIKLFLKELEAKGIHPESIILYGSYADGSATPDSDVDLIVISNDFKDIEPLERLRLLSHAAWPVRSGIEAQGFTRDEIDKNGRDSILWAIIQKKHKIIYEKAA